MAGYLRRPGRPHRCEMPEDYKYGDQSGVGAVWRCYCQKLYVFEARWWFGDFPPWWHRALPQWHRARWWQWLRWSDEY